MSQRINIAIFGDLHGRMLLPFHLASLWQDAHSEEVHYALSVGDVGIFRSVHQMDKPSRRFAERYPEELGFPRFFFSFDENTRKIQRHPIAEDVLDRVSFDLLVVPGNHEEHGYLEHVRSQYARSEVDSVAVDCDWDGMAAGLYGKDEFTGHGRVQILPQGKIIQLLGPCEEGGDWAPRFWIRLLALNGLPNYTPESAWQTRRMTDVDIMISHETYQGRFASLDDERDAHLGSQRLGDVLRMVSPRYHFSGHHHRYAAEIALGADGGRVVRSVPLNQMIFRDRAATISAGCFGVLTVDANGGWRFQNVEDEWFRNLRYADCAHVL